MTEFTTWRSLVDGAEITAIPDALVLDDWADSPDINGEIHNRDDFETLDYQGPDPEERFTVSGSRPTWTIASGDPSVNDSSEELNIGMEDIVHCDAPTDFDNVELRINFNISGDIGLFGFGTDSNPQYSQSTSIENSYLLDIRDDDRLLFVVDDNGDRSELISGSFEQGTAKITRNSNSEFELFINGQSQGTSTDNTHTEFETIFLAGRETLSVDFDVNWLETYKNDELAD